MIDTIILIIPYGQYEITDWKKLPNLKKVFSKSYFKIAINPTSKQCGLNYFPRLTLQNRMSPIGYVQELKIEFSAPAIKHGNNLYEVNEKYFEEIISLLHSRLISMGFLISEENIMNASVLLFHPSKNIIISGGSTATMVIRKLEKIDLMQRFDLETIKFRNGGTSLQFHSRSFSMVFYDKILDLGKTSTGITTSQYTLFKELLELRKHKFVEVLKIEIRMNKRKMNTILKKLGHTINPTFKDIFKDNICQQILQHYWKEIIEERGNSFIFLPDIDDLEKDFQFILGNSSISPKKALSLASLKFLIRNVGVSYLKNTIIEKRGKNALVRFSDSIKELDKIFANKKIKSSYIKDIERTLAEMEPLSKNRLFSPYYRPKIRSPETCLGSS